MVPDPSSETEAQRAGDRSTRPLDRVAIFYAPDAYSVAMPQLMGRNVAGDSFLRGLARHAGGVEIHAAVDDRDHGRHFIERLSNLGRSNRPKIVDRRTTAMLADIGTLFHPAPDIEKHARRRNPFGAASWSLCGITHTTASARVMDALTGLVTGTTRPWDAIVCTSNAVRANVDRLIELEIARLAERFEIRATDLPRLPVIPLGVDVDEFGISDAERADARAAIGISPTASVVLFVGRLSFHAKANPIAMYAALERAAQASGREVVLIEAGWFANDAIRTAFEQASATLCPSVRVLRLDGRQAADRRRAWAAADVFCSLSDNIQETFGLTPVEAMAAGLPVVASDWDGYRDTVRDGVEGYLVRTLMPVAGAGPDIAFRHAVGLDDYDRYCANTSALTAVDIEGAAAAFTRLFASPEQRLRMGAAGRARAVEVYDWSQIVPRYLDLWAELAEIRRSAAVAPAPWPGRTDPFQIFAGHPTDGMSPATRVVAMPGAGTELLDTRLGLAVVGYAAPLLASRDEMARVLEVLARDGAMSVDRAIERSGGARTVTMLRSMAWLAKVGLVRWASHDKAGGSSRGCGRSEPGAG